MADVFKQDMKKVGVQSANRCWEYKVWSTLNYFCIKTRGLEDGSLKAKIQDKSLCGAQAFGTEKREMSTFCGFNMRMGMPPSNFS